MDPARVAPLRHALLLLPLLAAASAPPEAEVAPSASAPTARWAGRPLRALLVELRRSGLRLIYSYDVVHERMTVSDEPTSADPLEALREILPPLGLALREGPDGTWLIVSAAEAASRAFVSGRVVALPGGEPLEGAIVTLSGGPRTRSGADGRFAISARRTRAAELTVEAIGFLRRRLALPAGGARGIVVELVRREELVTEVVVTPSRLSVLRQEQAPALELDRDDIIVVPAIGDDATRVIELMPGVAAPDSSAAFSIRGGEVRDVSLILDGLEIYEPFHLASFQSPFSYIDSNLLERIELYGGGFTADFGDRHGGLVRLTTEREPQRRSTTIELGTINSRITHSGPIGDGIATTVSARAWYPEAVRDTISLGDDGIDPRLQDLYARLDWSGSSGTLYSAHALAARNRLDFSETEDDETESADVLNRAGYLWLRAMSAWSDAWIADSVLSIGRIETDRDGQSVTDLGQTLVSDRRAVSLLGLRHDATWNASASHALRLGFDLRWLDADYAYAESPAGEEPTLVRTSPGGMTYGSYAAYRGRLGRRLATEVGLRWDRQQHTDDSQISPRVNLVWRPAPGSELKIGAGRFYQSQRINELQVEDGEREFRRAELSEQAVVSFRRRLRSGRLLRVDAYYRWLSDVQPRYENLFNPVELYPETEPDRIRIAPQNSRAHGIELLLRSRPQQPLTWWVSYALSSTEDIIDGESVPRRWDQTHAGRFLLGYRWTSGWLVSLTGSAHSGWPTTPIEPGITTGPDGEIEIEPIPGDRNSERFPSYFRLDLALSRTFPLRRGEVSVELEFVNLTDEENVCCVDEVEFELREDGTVVATPELDYWLGRTPSASVRWTF
jgi:outer membrane receptor protein involved in Fe transport